MPKRFKRIIHVVDSTTIQLIANCLDWAKHRRRKAAAKMHLRLDLHSFLPNFILVKSADTHDSTEAPELCAGVNAGEIVVFDKAYVDFNHLWKLFQRGVFWITRAKDNMKYEVVGQHSDSKLNILRDVVIRLTGQRTSVRYPETLRLVEAMVEVDGKLKRMTFITDNFTWAASSICDLYKARWAIEVFFKEIKQTLQLADFLGTSENAIIVLDINNIMCYITIPKHGEWYDENNTRHQKYFGEAQRTAAERSLRSISVWYNRTFFCKNS